MTNTYTKEQIEKDVIEIASRYIKSDDSFELFKAEMGWSDWMLEFCHDESSQEDGGELTESDSNRIDEFLLSCWKKAESNIEDEE